MANPRRRRRYHRRRNPSGLRIGEIVKDMLFGAAGAMATRIASGAVRGFIPGSFANQQYTTPLTQAVIAVFVVGPLAKKFISQKSADMARLGGLISAGLALADAYAPNLQNQLAGYLPIMGAPAQLPAVAPVTGGGLGDVYDVNLVDAGFGSFGDVEEVPQGIFS